MQTQAQMQGDRRVPARRRVLQSGKLVYGGGFTIDCVLRDRSESGVRVRASQDLLPREVVLISVSEGKAYAGEIVWRDGDQAGLRLREARDLKGPVDQAFRHARALWAEHALRDWSADPDGVEGRESLD